MQKHSAYSVEVAEGGRLLHSEIFEDSTSQPVKVTGVRHDEAGGWERVSWPVTRSAMASPKDIATQRNDIVRNCFFSKVKISHKCLIKGKRPRLTPK